MRTKVKVYFYLEEEESNKFLTNIKEKGWTLNEVANFVGLSYSHLYQVVHGMKSLTIELARKLEYFGLEYDFLKWVR